MIVEGFPVRSKRQIMNKKILRIFEIWKKKPWFFFQKLHFCFILVFHLSHLDNNFQTHKPFKITFWSWVSNPLTKNDFEVFISPEIVLEVSQWHQWYYFSIVKKKICFKVWTNQIQLKILSHFNNNFQTYKPSKITFCPWVFKPMNKKWFWSVYELGNCSWSHSKSWNCNWSKTNKKGCFIKHEFQFSCDDILKIFKNSWVNFHQRLFPKVHQSQIFSGEHIQCAWKVSKPNQ